MFLFGDVKTGFSAGPAHAAHSPGVLPRTAVYAAGGEAPPRRRLSAVQQQALDCLRGLGCRSLGPDFTVGELKSAFRSLAFRYHPDRHPGSGDAERAQLSRAFAGLCDAYRTLTYVH